MDRSDPQRPVVADTAAEKSEAPKELEPAAEPRLQEPPHADDAGADVPPLTEAEADAIERAYFDLSERETTQPVRRYAAFSDDVQSEPPVHADASPAPESAPTAWESAPVYAFEPRPFEVPPPADEPTMPAPVWPVTEAEPVAAEPAPIVSEDTPGVAELSPSVDETYPQIESCAPVPATAAPAEAPSFTLAVPALAVPALDERREPAFEAASPQIPLAVTADAVASHAALADAEPAPRDWRDLARRAANVALLVFTGWLIAVLMLIAVYRFINPPFSMLMAQRFLGGTAIAKQWVPIESISPNLARAVIVAEDGRFCHHWGIDLVEAANAIRRSSSGYPRGASTITMQVTKNLFLVPTKSYLRKMIEIPLTFAIELAWPKTRILEIYLNIVEWGPGIFGAEAASRAHFGRSAAGLSSRQAAQLAAVLPNPIVRDAGDPGPRTARKASIIQARAARSPEASECINGRR